MRLTGKSRSTIYNVLSGNWAPKYGGPATLYRDVAVKWVVDDRRNGLPPIRRDTQHRHRHRTRQLTSRILDRECEKGEGR